MRSAAAYRRIIPIPVAIAFADAAITHTNPSSGPLLIEIETAEGRFRTAAKRSVRMMITLTRAAKYVREETGCTLRTAKSSGEMIVAPNSSRISDARKMDVGMSTMEAAIEGSLLPQGTNANIIPRIR